jgi:alkanesulfonate monooxygenase SsuD/methylene tetrahydromethanopterin reductase-like flavin-dependent oxidoreductase (luciferase family)
MRHALMLPPFDALADPSAMADIAGEVEAGGWDGLFIWDHVLRPDDEDGSDVVADATVMLAAIAAATERINLGAMVTPITRRRPIKLAREILSLDRLAGGRLICGFGLGVDSGRELSAFGEEVDARTRGEMLDEGADLLASLVAGHHVDHRGSHYTALDVTLDPGYERERPPFWFAAREGATLPARRAARFEGLFPIESSVEQVKANLATVAEERGDLDGFDCAVITTPELDLAPFAAAGATWAMHGFWPPNTVAQVVEYARGGPA